MSLRYDKDPLGLNMDLGLDETPRRSYELNIKELPNKGNLPSPVNSNAKSKSPSSILGSSPMNRQVSDQRSIIHNSYAEESYKKRYAIEK